MSKIQEGSLDCLDWLCRGSSCWLPSGLLLCVWAGEAEGRHLCTTAVPDPGLGTCDVVHRFFSAVQLDKYHDPLYK